MLNKEKLQQLFGNLGAVWHAIWMNIGHNDSQIYSHENLEIAGEELTPIPVDLGE